MKDRQQDAEYLTVGTLNFVVAAYGAVLATYLGHLAYRRERHRLRIRLRLEAIDDEDPCLAVHVVNTGSRPVTVTSGSFIYDDDSGRLGIDSPASPLPSRLEDGDEVVLRVPIDYVPSAAFGYVVDDTTGRQHVAPFTTTFREQMELFRKMFGSSPQ